MNKKGLFYRQFILPCMPRYFAEEGGGGEAPALPEGFDIAALQGDNWAGILNTHESFKDNQVALNTKSPLDAIEQLVNANKLLGQDRLPSPQDDWDEDKWNTFYNSLGRPESAADYKYENAPKIEGFEVSEEFTKTANEKMFAAGLNNKQQNAVMDSFYEWLGSATEASSQAETLAKQQSSEALKAKYGEKMEGMVAEANAIIANYGSPELADMLETTGLGNDPHIQDFLFKLADTFRDDAAFGESLNLNLSAENGAKKKIAELKSDEAFVRRLNNAEAPMHAEAVAEWQDLHKKAFPTK